jgi:uncharacterized protein (DUF433 family)
VPGDEGLELLAEDFGAGQDQRFEDSEEIGMQFEDYFEFLAPDEIKIKGHRIWMQDVLYEYIHAAMTVEELAERFDTLSLEQIHAVILYYLHNKETMDKYMADWLEYCRKSREEDLRKRPEFYEKLRRLLSQQMAEQHRKQRAV